MTDPAELFESISHPTRIGILRILEKQPRSFSALKRELKIESSGNIDHHIKKLGELVNVGDDGLYVLTDAGREALRAIDAIDMWKRLEERRISVFAEASRELKALITIEAVLTFATAFFVIGSFTVLRFSSEIFFQPVYTAAIVMGSLSIYGFVKGKLWTWTLIVVKASMILSHALIPLYYAALLSQATESQSFYWMLLRFLPIGVLTVVFVLAEAGVLFLASRRKVRESLGSKFTTSLPRRTLIGGILGMAGGLSQIIAGCAMMFSPGPYGAGPLGIMGFFMFASGLTITIGGVLILLRRYTVGGLMVVIFNLFPITNLTTPQVLILLLFPQLVGYVALLWLAGFPIFILFIMGGVLALLSRHKP